MKFYIKVFLSIFSVLVLMSIQSCSMTPYVTAAKIDLERGDFASAETQLKTAIKRNSENEEAYYIIGEIYSKEGMFKKMKTNFDKALTLSKTHEEAIGKHYDSAYKSLENISIKSYNTGVQALSNKNKEKALKAFRIGKDNLELALKIKPGVPMAIKLLGNISLNINQKEKALGYYKNYLKQNPDDIQVLKYTAMLLKEKKMEKEALSHMLKIYELAPELKDNIIAIATYYNNNNKMLEAIVMYEEVLRVDKNNIDVLFNKGLIHKKMKQPDEAISCFSKIVKIAPSDAEAKLLLARLYYDENSFDKVTELLADSAENISDKFKKDTYALLFDSFIKLNKPVKAKKFFLE